RHRRGDRRRRGRCARLARPEEEDEDAAPRPPLMPGVTYRLTMAEPQTHHFMVDVEADGVTGPARLVMPSWTPGSYLMREFPRNVVTFAAADGAGNLLPSRKTDKNSWLVDAPADGRLRARYLVHADELSVRTSHLDASHGFVNGTSVFMYLDGRQ